MKQKKTTAWIAVCLMLCAMALFGTAGCGSAGGEQAAENATVEATEATEANADEMISEGEALENAFDAAGLYIDDADDINVQFNDGEAGYDIEFRMEGVKYEYFVDAHTGEVYEYY